MPTWFRKVLVALVALLLVAVASAVWWASTFDANRYKGLVINWMQTQHHRTLAITGPVALSVFPRIELRLHGLSLSEAGSAQAFASIGDAALAVDVLPLLHGELNVGSIEARGVSAVLLRDANGKRNIDDLLHPAPADAATPAPPASAATSAAPGGDRRLRFDLRRLVLADVTARIQDEVAGRYGTLQLKELRTGRIASGIETPVTLAASFDFTKPALKGELSGSLKLTPDLGSGALHLADVDLKLAAATADIRLADTTLAVARFDVDPAQQAFAVGKLQLRVKGAVGERPLTVDLDWPEFKVRGDSIQGGAVSATLALGGDHAVTASLQSGAPGGRFDALTFDALEFKLTARQAGLAPLALAARGQVGTSPKGAGWTLAGQANGQPFNTAGSVALVGTVPKLKAQARFAALDLNALLAPAKATTAATPVARQAAATPIDLAPLRRLDADLDLQVGQFAYRQYRIADARLVLVLAAGVLHVNTLQGKLWGGSVDGTASADAHGNRVAVKAVASGVNVNALLKDLAERDMLEGTGRVTLDVASSGGSIGELKSHLQGTAALQLRDGAVKGVNLAKSFRQAKALFGQQQDAEQSADHGEQTDFSELNASFRIDGGVARNTDLDLKSPFFRIGGNGAVDLGQSRIDYTARATVTDTPQGQGGAELAALRGVTVPVHLTGPLDAVTWKIQWSGVVLGTLRNQLEDKLKAGLGIKPAANGASAPSTQDLLKEKLKGLFK